MIAAAPAPRGMAYVNLSRDRFKYQQNPMIRQHAVREFAFGFKLITPPKTP